MTLTEQEQYAIVCKPQLERIEQMLADMNRRLFIGNGLPSLVVRVSRNEDSLAFLRRVVWMCVGGIVSVIVAVVAYKLTAGETP
jgi:hypothetical protein